MPKPVALDTGVIAFATLVKILDQPIVMDAMEVPDVDLVAQHLLTYAEPEYKPTARKLVLTFDLSGSIEQETDSGPVDPPLSALPD